MANLSIGANWLDSKGIQYLTWLTALRNSSRYGDLHHALSNVVV